MAFTGVDFGSFFEEGEGLAFEGGGGFVKFFGIVSGDGFALELGFGGSEDGLDPRVDRVFGDLLQDGEACLR